MTISWQERFWSKVVQGPDCWGWTDKSRSNGFYGLLKVHGRYRTIHRLSWELHFGPIPDGLWVLHRCDNPLCTRPDHLFLGTALDNERDKIAKGRRPDAWTGRKHTDEARAKMRGPRRPLLPRVDCPDCGRSVTPNTIGRHRAAHAPL